MNIEDLITLLRNEVEKTEYKCYSPDLPPTEEMCSAVSLGEGINTASLGDVLLYSTIPFYILIKGSQDDKETRKLADRVFNQLNKKENIILNDVRIIRISCNTPNYAFRDENQRIHYNINAIVNVEWKEEK